MKLLFILLTCVLVPAIDAQDDSGARRNRSGFLYIGRDLDAVRDGGDVAGRLYVAPSSTSKKCTLEWDIWKKETTIRVELPFTRFGSLERVSQREYLLSGCSVDAKGRPLHGHIVLIRLRPGSPDLIQIVAAKEYADLDACSATWNPVEGRLYVLDAKLKRLMFAAWPGRRARTFLPKEAEFVQVMDSKGCSALKLATLLDPYSPMFQLGIVLSQYGHVYEHGEKWKVSGTRRFKGFDRLKPDMEEGLRRARTGVLPYTHKNAKGRTVETGMLEVPSNPGSYPSQFRWVDYAGKKTLALDLPFTRFGSMQEIGQHVILLSGCSLDENEEPECGYLLVVRVTPGPGRKIQLLLKQDYPGLDVFSCVWNATEGRLYLLDASRRRILHAPWSGIEKRGHLPHLDKFQQVADRELVPDLDMSLGRGLYSHAGIPGVILTKGDGIRWLRQEGKDWKVKWFWSIGQIPQPK